MSEHLEHTDIIRISGQSHTSVDDAINSALEQLVNPAHGHNHHPDLTFQSFEVAKISGYIHHDADAKAIKVKHFKVVLEVEGAHKH